MHCQSREAVWPTSGDCDGEPERILGWKSTGDARRYRGYQVARLARYVKGSVLDVGAKTGELSRLLLASRRAKIDELVLSDRSTDWLLHLERAFPDEKLIYLNLPAKVRAEVDTVLAVNVLGFIEDEEGALRSLVEAIRPGGRLVIWEAGCPALYSGFDREKAGRLRRYTRKDLTGKLEAAGLETEVCRPINALGAIFNWFVVRRMSDVGDPRAVRIYDRTVVPVSRLLDHLRLPFGQNIIAVAKMPEA
ncbi:methyltransferase domain-containing protein [Actinomadura sp. KC345]|uniref:methyltransferase domain-containing protein n=1 Tax=Actinomadura sp. KC345 TaxID=2530371 RepID=UPI001404FAEA|nr:methyltransferase domain-containing protein [Actinomadura sp. KC345]